MPLPAAGATKSVAGEGVTEDVKNIDEDEGDDDNGRSLLLDVEFGRSAASQTSQAQQLDWPIGHCLLCGYSHAGTLNDRLGESFPTARGTCRTHVHTQVYIHVYPHVYTHVDEHCWMLS